jgi:hypothetical protein
VRQLPVCSLLLVFVQLLLCLELKDMLLLYLLPESSLLLVDAKLLLLNL